mgnify:CR=1 FL=1
MAEASKIKGKYLPALTNAEAVNPTTEPGIGLTYAVGFLQYLGILKYGNATLRVWSPFIDTDFWNGIEPSTVVVKDGDNAPIEGACKLAGVKAAGIKFYLDASLIQRAAGDRITIEMKPDESWPILDKRWAPSHGAAAFPFPEEWVLPAP